MARVKGKLLAVRIAYLDERCPPENREAVLRALPPRVAEALEKPLETSAWYPFRHLVHLNRALEDVLGGDDRDPLLDVGRFAAEVALADVRDSLIAEGSPRFLFRHAPSVWHQHYDSGHVLTVDLAPTSGTIHVEDFDDPAPEHCASVRGWILATIELTGVQGASVEETKCRCRGDDLCEFRCRWAAAASA